MRQVGERLPCALAPKIPRCQCWTPVQIFRRLTLLHTLKISDNFGQLMKKRSNILLTDKSKPLRKNNRNLISMLCRNSVFYPASLVVFRALNRNKGGTAAKKRGGTCKCRAQRQHPSTQVINVTLLTKVLRFY